MEEGDPLLPEVGVTWDISQPPPAFADFVCADLSQLPFAGSDISALLPTLVGSISSIESELPLRWCIHLGMSTIIIACDSASAENLSRFVCSALVRYVSLHIVITVRLTQTDVPILMRQRLGTLEPTAQKRLSFALSTSDLLQLVPNLSDLRLSFDRSESIALRVHKLCRSNPQMQIWQHYLKWWRSERISFLFLSSLSADQFCRLEDSPERTLFELTLQFIAEVLKLEFRPL